MNNDILKTLYSKKDIEVACKRLANEITEYYQGKESPLVVGVLKGAVIFMTDVIRQVDAYVDMDFIDVSSYHGTTKSSGKVDLVTDINSDPKGRDILIMEDIVDTGRTLKFLIENLTKRGAKSVKVCTLLDKPEGRVVDTHSDFTGFQVPNEFVVGYGLDYEEKYRNLPYIGVLKPEIYQNN